MSSFLDLLIRRLPYTFELLIFNQTGGTWKGDAAMVEWTIKADTAEEFEREVSKVLDAMKFMHKAGEAVRELKEEKTRCWDVQRGDRLVLRGKDTCIRVILDDKQAVMAGLHESGGIFDYAPWHVDSWRLFRDGKEIQP